MSPARTRCPLRMSNFSTLPSKSAAMTFDTRELTTPTNSIGFAASAGAAWATAAVGSGSLGAVTRVPQAAASSSAPSCVTSECGFIGELRLVGGGRLRCSEQLGEETFAGRELIERALLNNTTLVHHDDDVCVANG